MKIKKFLYLFVVLIVFCSAFVVPLVVVADDSEVLVELSEDDYRAYIENELAKPVTYAVGDGLVTTKDYESTNVPKKSGAGSIGSSITTGILNFGKDIIEDIINDSTIENDSSGLQIPDFRQQIGKCRVVYSSGLVEILTCSLTTYSTQVIGNAGKPTGEYKPHAILTFIRETDSRYTVTTICDDESTQYCDSYSTVGTFSFGTYTSYSTTYANRFFDYDTQDTVVSPRVQLLGQRYTSFLFRDLEQIEEVNQSTFDMKNLFFGTATRQGLPEINSGYQYKPLYSLVSGANMFGSSTNGTSIQGLCLATANTITNSYSDYVQMKDVEDTPEREQKQSVTYLSEINSTNIYNENTIKNYDFLTYIDGRITTNAIFSGYWENSVETVINNNVYNTYNNYWTQEPEPTQPPETVPPTDPPEPTQPDTYPPATLPSEPTETYPVATLPTETYRIVDFETLETVSLEVGTLPDMYEFPEVAEVGGLVLQQSTSFLDKVGLLPVYITLGVLSIAVFIMRGQK